ncbi:MAG: hypothetical protein CGU28_04180 [Candidatus Dactylopiibacterium carminicum]|uniref:Uncharacterized protein n=1 Tax=Candidatus Dactylopiibacterium carminicum TaxID=857335 RepID=A0A272EXP8_9RHOO|nr:hypothetical protein [Candidatus Dactylopiibacterium carminicum]KAF7600164.1 hypothetical protein BGI27_03655 [Candidatus Dactylopiibacterium carminicum]PAS94816.1 MAG: hypothetical protein CGU29_02645 [Candidatus Dactylopiibacterium carminicum]PAS97740.1 MAG: hypothetical protein CGU28_04180 [Candidatus Dactylopiibacterium carminicum]PAT00167.1 MAG: hypothetical protein BSR46_03685 [Candidatus Dactylopiibacterium carminicum]
MRAHTWSVRESTDKGGYCTVTIEFVPGGETAQPTPDRVDVAAGCITTLTDGVVDVRRQALTSAARLEALDMVRTALTTRAPALTDVEVQEVTPDDPAGNVSSVLIEISGLHNGRKFIVRVAL